MDDLKAGVYRHYKGPLYLVLGFAHDANAGELYNADDVNEAEGAWPSGIMHQIAPIGDRDVVVYIGLQLDDAHTGPRLAVRTYDDFFARVCGDVNCSHYGTESGITCRYCQCAALPRFEYVGPTWEGHG